MKLSNRLNRVPEYIFSCIDEIKNELSEKGIDIIDLGIGDPDIPTPGFIVDSLKKSVSDARNHRYPPYSGIKDFKDAVAQYYKRNFNVKLDSRNEVAALIGSKEGIAHLFLSITDIGDYVIIPDPGYPVYNASAVISGCIPYTMLLNENHDYIPVLNNIYPEVLKKAKLLVINYPNNPTGAVATLDFYNKLVRFGLDNNIVIANDGAYIEYFDKNADRLSILQADNAIENCVEFGTLSKSYNMTGWRLGYIAGNREVIKKLMIVKTNFDSGQFAAIQRAGTDALNNGDFFTDSMRSIYEERRSIVLNVLISKGIHAYGSKGAFYVWFRVPKEYKSQEFAAFILEKTGVIITPGNTFGDNGEGYCRISLTVCNDIIRKAMKRIEELDF